MLNSHYKIFAKIIANRLQSVLPTLIAKEQVGFMKNRCISENLRELLTVIEYCQQNNIEAVLTALDFEKSFELVDSHEANHVEIQILTQVHKIGHDVL